MGTMSDEEKTFVGIERRRRSGAFSIEELKEYIEERIKDSRETEIVLMNKRFDSMEQMFKSAFPDGDPRKHRDYHQEQIDYIREQREFYADLKKKSAFGLLVFFASAIGMAMWEYLKKKLAGG